MSKRSFLFILSFLFAHIVSCDPPKTEQDPRKPAYVKPTITRNGQFRKGHVRRSVSTKKNSYINRSRSRYYYQTRGKYRSRKRK